MQRFSNSIFISANNDLARNILPTDYPDHVIPTIIERGIMDQYFHFNSRQITHYS